MINIEKYAYWRGVQYPPSLFFFLFSSNCLLVIMPLSISDLSIEGSMLIISLETPDGYCFVGLLTIELFTLNNDNPEDIKPFTACSPNKTFLTLSLIQILVSTL